LGLGVAMACLRCPIGGHHPPAETSLFVVVGWTSDRGAGQMPTMLQADTIGPVDVAVITFTGSDFTRTIAPALADLESSGTVRVIDLAFVRKASDGSTSIVEPADDTVAEAFERITDSQVDLLSDADLADLADTLTPETLAMVVVWENSWAARFATSVRSLDGRVAMLERIPHENVERAIIALDTESSGGAVEA
jgi:hypothetical protein